MNTEYEPEQFKPLNETSEPLLGSSQNIPDVQSLVSDYELQQATASPFSCIINLANTILGTGMLAMVKICIVFVICVCV